MAFTRARKPLTGGSVRGGAGSTATTGSTRKRRTSSGGLTGGIKTGTPVRGKVAQPINRGKVQTPVQPIKSRKTYTK